MRASELASPRRLLLAALGLGFGLTGCPPALNRPPPGGPELGTDLRAGDHGAAEASVVVDAARDRGPDVKVCGSDSACDDGLSCTTDSCAAGACKHTVQAGSCAIAGVCYAAGATAPQDPCKVCDPAAASGDWTRAVCVTTLAGSGAPGAADGPAASASFHNPTGVAVDAAGALVIVADGLNRKVRQISLGQVTTLAGLGPPGFADGAAASATFMLPHGVALDPATGTVYVADRDLHRIRRIAGGQVSTFAGKTGDGDDDGPALSAGFRFPTGLLVAKGQVVVADSENHRLRAITIGSSPVVTTVAGSSVGYKDGPAGDAELDSPQGVAFDPVTGKVVIADRDNHRVRSAGSGVVGTLAGSLPGFADGPAATAKLNAPTGVAIDAKGTVFIADRNNHRIRMLDASGVTTLAGGVAGWQDGPATKARFNLPTGIAVDGAGRIFVADTGNQRIRLITR
jgi:DNA-binding beta-propeller fold protein YncE